LTFSPLLTQGGQKNLHKEWLFCLTHWGMRKSTILEFSNASVTSSVHMDLHLFSVGKALLLQMSKQSWVRFSLSLSLSLSLCLSTCPSIYLSVHLF
jgi:hypothetical protein